MNYGMLNLCRYFLWFVFYSFVGWVYESILCSVTEKRLINRGFLNGPYCPIYGSGAVAVIAALSSIDNIFLLFFCGAGLACTIEYITSWAMEKMFHARWWDYTYRKFNIKGRICLIGAVVFGTFSVFLIKLFHPYVSYVTGKMPYDVLLFTSVSFAILMCTDCVFTVCGIMKFDEKLRQAQSAVNSFIKESRERAEELKKTLGEYVSESGELKKSVEGTIIDKAEDVKNAIGRNVYNTREIKRSIQDSLEESVEESAVKVEKMKQMLEDALKNTKAKEYIRSMSQRLNSQERRMINAFPSFRSTRYDDTLKKIRNAIRKREN